MECPSKSGQGPELFIGYAAHTLPLAERRALEWHLAVCTECRRTAEAQQLVWAALDSFGPGDISPDFDRRLYARIAAEEKLPWYRRVRLATWSLRPAISVVAVGALVLAGYFLREPMAEPSHESHGTLENRIDIEQVERALDDIEMLNQMGIVVPSDQTSASEPI